jgi:hypothetical protein
MTGQIPDTCDYAGRRWDLAGYSGGALPSPLDFGMRVVSTNTGCWRGYILRLAVEDGRLLLSEMEVGHAPEGYLPVGGVTPEAGEYGAMTYRGLRLPLSFSGQLLLCRDFIRERYIHMGFQAPQSYGSVVELDIADGRLSGETDRSAEMARVRELQDTGQGGEPANPLDWIERSFRREIPPDEA